MSSSRPPVKLSAREAELYALLPANGSRVSSVQLMERYYGDARPMNARTIIIARLRGIAHKLEFAAASTRLRKSPRTGPIPQQFWLERIHDGG